MTHHPHQIAAIAMPMNMTIVSIHAIATDGNGLMLLIHSTDRWLSNGDRT
ncbi:MAG: hypothetical protein ACFE0I_12910 [Elainellaceae cyanobacterium]